MDLCRLGVEILSPSNRAYDEQVKLAAYGRAGLPEHVIIGPAARTLRHYVLQAAGQYAPSRQYGGTETMHFNRLPAISLQVGQLFEGAQDSTL